MLQRQEKASRFDQFNRNSLGSVNVWIAYVRNENERKIFRDTLNNSPLRFDSHVFEFFEEGSGGFNFNVKLVAARYKVCYTMCACDEMNFSSCMSQKREEEKYLFRMFTKLMNAVRILRLPFMAILTPLMAFSILLNQTCGNEGVTFSFILSSNDIFNIPVILCIYTYSISFIVFKALFLRYFQSRNFQEMGKSDYLCRRWMWLLEVF